MSLPVRRVVCQRVYSVKKWGTAPPPPKTSSLLTLLLAVLFLVPVVANADVHYVDSSRPDDTGDGLSWATAEKTIQAAIDAATSGDEVWVKAGTYTFSDSGNIQGGANNVIELKSGVSVYGGFVGTETELTGRDAATNVTVIDAENGTDRRCVYGASGALLNGFTIKRGNESGNGGSGLYISGFSMTVEDCRFENNTLSNAYGGAVHIYNGSPIFTNCVFVSNSTNEYGGAVNIQTNTGTPPSYNTTFDNCIFKSNSASIRAGVTCPRLRYHLLS